jgi:hypothetical protein
MQRAFEDPSLTLDDLRQHWVEAWQRHDADLRTYFAGRNNFFEFDITVSNEQAALCFFCGDWAIASAVMLCPTLELVRCSLKIHE